jgi:hypothetical protein
MPKGQAPNSKKVKKFSKDYVGKYDGSKAKWMTRRSIDKGGNVKTNMVPNSSKPTEANDYHEMFDRKKFDKSQKPTRLKDSVFPKKKK